MSEKTRFDQVRDDMEERKRQAMARSSDLKTEVETAINELKKRDLADEVKTQLVTRFSEVSHIAGVGESQVKDLIDGFTQLDARFEAQKAIENLKSILQSKQAETREFENQSKSK